MKIGGKSKLDWFSENGAMSEGMEMYYVGGFCEWTDTVTWGPVHQWQSELQSGE